MSKSFIEDEAADGLWSQYSSMVLNDVSCTAAVILQDQDSRYERPRSAVAESGVKILLGRLAPPKS